MRPKIICHMISSIDGRLLVDRWTEQAAEFEADMSARYFDQIPLNDSKTFESVFETGRY
jgi:hypothetical protein